MKEITNRLNSVIQTDKNYNFKYLSELLRSDLYYLLGNYFEVEFNSISPKIEVGTNGKFNILISADAIRVKLPKMMEN